MERVAQAEYSRLGLGLGHDEYLESLGAYRASARMVDLVDILIEKANDRTEREQSDSDERAYPFGVSNPYF